MSYVAMICTCMTAVVLGVAGIVLLSLGLWNHAKEYAKAQRAMNRTLSTLSAGPRGRFATSKTVSRPENADRSRAA